MSNQPGGNVAAQMGDNPQYQNYMDEFNKQKQQRIETMVWGGPLGYKQYKAPMYIGMNAPVPAGEMDEASQKIFDDFVKKNGWATPEMQQAERMKIARKMGYTGNYGEVAPKPQQPALTATPPPTTPQQKPQPKPSPFITRKPQATAQGF